MKFNTEIVQFFEQPDKNRVGVMMLGRPGIYYASMEDGKLVEQLRGARAKGTPLAIECDGDLRIVSASAAVFDR